MSAFRPSSLLSGLALAAACGGSPPEPASPETPAASAPTGTAEEPEQVTPPSEPPSDIAWKDMKRDQRIAYMKTKVLPEMTASFRSYDPKQFAKVTCVTCHGEGAKKGEFDMPTAALPKLSPEGSFKKHMDDNPAITKFMMDKVVPQMATLLGEQPYDPATQKGFGCFGCHMPEK